MRHCRIIARLDIKGPNLIKGINLEGLRVMGDPRLFAQEYCEQGIDELIYIDSVASLYGRNNLSDIVSYTAQNIFIPLTVGGGIRSLQDVEKMLKSGADKVAINTAAVNRPALISEVSKAFGSQCMVLNIEAKLKAPGKWEVYTDNGREKTGMDVVEWVKKGVDLGAGEVLLTSVDREGTRKGFDVDLVKAISPFVTVPVIASGGMGQLNHLKEVVEYGQADAVAIADGLHYKRFTVREMKEALTSESVVLRMSS